jgi:hypothetical protein
MKLTGWNEVRQSETVLGMLKCMGGGVKRKQPPLENFFAVLTYPHLGGRVFRFV